MQTDKKSSLRRFISYYIPYKGLFFLDMLFVSINALAALGMPLLVRHLLNNVLRMGDKAAMFQQILLVSCGLFLLYLVQALSSYVVSSWGHIMGAKMETDMRQQLFNHMEMLSFSYFDQGDTGQMMSRVVSDLADISELAHHGPENFWTAALQFTGAFIILIMIDVPMTLVLFIVSVLMFFFLRYFSSKMRRTFMDNRRKIAQVNAIVQDSFSGIRTVQSFGNEAVEQQKFRKGNEEFLRSKARNYMVMGQYASSNVLLQGFMYLAVVLVGGLSVLQGRMDGVDVIVYLLYIGTFLDPIKKIVNFNEQLQRGKTGFERMLEILDTHPDVQDRPGAIEAGKLDGHISFRAVDFTYKEEDGPVLQNLNLEIPARRTVALVGPSGAGKSTICSLIPRFYDVSGGCIEIDGRDLRDYSLQSLRANIGVVQQDVYIFNASVRDNIAYGAPEASLEEIQEAARKAHIHDFIMSLPEGYETMMGERGVRFSGGQKQRISIARVFLMNPPILILDEATSALDNESEILIQDSLHELAQNRTSLVIAHRLSTIRDADEILVLTEQGLQERGTHQELLARDGLYARLYSLQFRD